MTQHVVTLSSDDYFLLYEVKVQAYNVKGDGPESPVVSIYSSEGRTYNRKIKSLLSVLVNVDFIPNAVLSYLLLLL